MPCLQNSMSNSNLPRQPLLTPPQRLLALPQVCRSQKSLEGVDKSFHDVLHLPVDTKIASVLVLSLVLLYAGIIAKCYRSITIRIGMDHPGL